MEILPSQIVYADKPTSFYSSSSVFFFNKHRWMPFLHCHFHLFPQQPQIQKSIICARNKRRQFGSARSRKLMLESAYFIASKFKILPEPLDLLVKEIGIGAGNGGGFRFWKGSGWGGFDGWGRRRKKRKMEILGILVILSIGIFFIWAWGKEYDANLLLGFLGLLLFGLSVDGRRKGVVKDWALGFFSCAVFIGLALKKEDFLMWVKRFGDVKLKMGRRRKRRAF